MHLEYKTDSLSLCPFLAMHDLQFKRVERLGPKKYLFVFADEKSQGSDLAIAFLKSTERQYKNFWSFFRNELAKAQHDGVTYETLEK